MSILFLNLIFLVLIFLNLIRKQQKHLGTTILCDCYTVFQFVSSIGTARIVCGAEFMHLFVVRPSVCLSMGHNSKVW